MTNPKPSDHPEPEEAYINLPPDEELSEEEELRLKKYREMFEQALCDQDEKRIQVIVTKIPRVE